MAERPLYTLYKNLKAQNYDVPDDYNKFESALTRDGKGGADNRHAIYENLKAQNFDVPSTYERFYSALFEPRSKTSSRAKGGSVPMSAADRARFSAGAAAISASAQQTMNNVGRYNRLKQRKQKQQKDFGRVNLGTHQTPYGGDANNVVKDDFAYNPETGKAGAYVTSDNENVYSQNDAEQKQAILDEQNSAYQQAVDTGEIPSVFDVRDKNGNYDLQENIGKNGTYLTEEGAQNQFDKKLADAYARKKEIEALIAEDNRQHGNPLLSYGASIGASNGRTSEQSDYRNKLATSLSLVTEQIGALEAVKQYPTSSWGEDALKALDNTAFTAKTWDFGLTDFATMGQMERIKTKMDNNIPLSGSDKMLLKSKLGADAAAALEDEKMGNIYRWTKIAGQSLPFMADFFLTGGYGGITKGISRGALKFAAKRGMGKVSAAILKNTGIVAGDVIGSYAMAGTEQALKTGADIMQRHLGNLYQDEKGDYKFGTFDENGNLLHEGGESMGTALYKGLTSAMVENYTEKLFGHNYGIKKGAVNFMEKHGMNASAEFFKNIGKSGWYTNSKKWMEKFGINGFAEEVMEEEIGIPLHALLDGEGKVSDLLDAKQQLDIIGGMAISVGSMYAMGAGSRPVKGIYNRAQYYRFRNKVNVADSDAQNLIGDNWSDIKDKIDNATNEQMGSVLAGILRQRDTMTKEQINAAVNYGVNLMKMRGYNIAKTAEMNAKEITNEPTTPEEQHQADIDNAYSEGHDADDADKHDMQIQQEDQMKTLAAALGISEQQLSAMSDEELESLTGQNDKLDQAIYDYQLSSARYQGVVDDAQDKVDLAAHQAEQRVDMYTDQSRGSVRNATIKASDGLEDYGVYIISGNVATHDDGSIDVSNSDDMILYYDPTTNSVEHADALMFAELGEELPADDVKAQAVADAKENAIKEVAGIIDGTVEVGSQFNVTDTDGTEHTYEVLADYGDGTAAISIDGNVVENPYSLADLQQMKDLEDQKRLEAAKAEREQMEKERAAQQTQETEQSQPSFDFNQILNDNGNVVLVDVLDKDGNTKYPDSKLFLIRDSGAKAKVVELKSDGTIVPHAVNKEDVATISSMSLDEYKQAMPESSMIEDNSGEESDEDSQLENLGLPKGSEIWMSGDGFGRPKENTQSKVVGIDEQGSIILEDKDGKKWSASFDYINNHRELPPLDENTNIVNEENNQSESNAEENTPAPEQTPAITLEDGTIVPMLEDGNPDFSKLTAAQTAELYDTQFGEDADSIVSGYVSDAKKALDKASNMTVKGNTFVEQKAAKDAKEKAIADAQAAYDSAIAIRDAYNERQLAKVEDTAEGRKELIEKARRKFARLKSAVKDDAEAVAQLYKETIGSLLHRLYDSTGIDVTDTTPLTAEEYVASNLGAHSLNYEGTETSKGVKQETGLSREDFAKTQLLAADGKGTTIDALVHSLWENRPSNLESLDTQDIRNALIGVLNSGFKASEARNFVENIRIAQAENILEEQKRAQENAAYAEQHKAEPEAELKAKSDEKAELKAKSEEKLDNKSDNKSNDLSNESDNENINDNINDNINTLTPEQQKAKEDGEKLGFPAVDKEGEPINEYVVELAEWAKEQGLEIDPTSKSNSYADLFLMCKDGFGVSTLVPDEGENINQVVYFPDNVQDFDQLWKLQEEFNAGRDLKHSSNIDSEITEGATFYDADTAREFKEFVDKNVEEQNKVFGEQRSEENLPFSAKENGKQQTTAERAADVEKNKVDDMKVVDNIVGEKTRKAFERLAKMMGASIQWQYSDKLGNGWIQETTDADGNVHRTIFITLDSSITEGAQFIFGHEMTHQIKSLNPAAYNELTQLVLDTYGSDAFDKAVDETMQRYSDAGFSGRARDYYAEEVVADAVGEMIRDLNLAHTLAMKMSHPLLAAIHEILQKIKLAFFGTEYSDVTKNIIRSIEQAYVKTAKGEVTNSETGEDVSFSLRQKPEPKKKGIGYKVFVLKDGKLYPPMVANPNGAATPVGVWLDADAAPIAGESKTGRPQVKQGGKGTQGGSGKLAYRPGWHLGVVPYAIQFNRKDAEGNKTLFPKNFVFAEVEYAADVDYQEEARQEGINPSGKYQHSLAGLKHLPTDGYYMYRTNPNPETDPWVITGAMKVNRILTRAEQAELVKNAGREPQQIQEGDIVTDDVVNSINQEIAAAPKFSIKTYHGSQASLDKFDHSFMGSGEGAQAYGWGTYVSEVEGIAKAYAKANAKKNAPSRLMYQGKPMTYKTPSIIYQVAFDMDKFNISAKEAISKMIDADEKKLASVGDTPFAKMKAKQVQDELKVLKDLNPSDFKINEDYDTIAQDLVDTKSGLDLLEDELKDAKSYVDLYQSRLDEAKEELSKAKESGTGLGIDMYESDIEYYSKQVERYKQSIKTKESDIKDVKTKVAALQKKLDSMEKPRNLYSVDIPDDTGDNYLGWDEPLNAKQIDMWKKALLSAVPESDRAYYEEWADGMLENRKKENNPLTGKDAYYAIDSKYASKKTSMTLSKAGFVGVKVIAQRNTGGNKEGKMNYVIFDENNAKITNHTKFSLRLKSAIEETETNPSDAQKESGNYKKGHIKFGGYDYTIENPKGSTRSGKDADGKEWKVTMHDTYGYIRGKFGKDGDHLDMFINDKADLDNWDGDVFVVDQVNPDGSFDEHKVMYGYDSMDDAKKAYLANYSKGWQGLGNITGASKDEFDKWLDTSNRKLKPFADYAKVKFSLKDIKPVGVGAFGNIYNQFRGNAKAAIEFLKEVRGGEAVGALHHKDIGDIDLVWGKEGTGHSDGYGLSKLVKYHPEVLDNLQEILNDMRVVSSSKNRVNLESETHKAGVRLTWDGERKSWLLTAFKKETSASDKRTDTAATSLEGDTALSQTEGSAAKIDNSSETAKENGEKFSLKDEKTLAGVHNITEEKLRKALKLGGFANPSLAVIDTNKSGHNNFGEISFIAPSALLDKRTGKTGGTWITDAYTQRYPSVERQMSEKGSQKFEDWVDSLEYPSAAKAEIKRQTKDVLEDNGVPAWELMYLKEKGIDIKAYDSNVDYRWKEIINDHPTSEDILSSMQNDPELKEKVTSLAKHAIIYPTWEKVSLEVRRKMYKETGVKASPINPQVRKQTKEIFERDYKSTLLNKDGSPRKKDVKKVVEDIVKEHNDTKKYDFYLSKVKASNYVNKNGLYDDYIRWQENKLDEFGTKNRIFRGYTRDGSRKYVPETLENVSKAMREEADGQTNGSEYTSFGSFIAKLASRVDSTDEMRANKDKLSSNKDKEEFYEKWSEVYYDLAKFLYNDVFYGEQRLHDIVLQSDPKKYAKKEYGITLTPTFMKKLDALKNAVQTELKSAYFETKYNRPLRLNEFAAVVVPDNLGEDVRKGIENAGLPMYDYDPNKEGDRSRAFNEAINSSDNIRFSLKSMMAKPEGWKQANKKAIHIVEAIERDPKFSLKNLDGTLIKAGTYFSGGGLVEEGLKGIIDPVVAVEYDEKISGVYRNNFGQHIVTADVRDVDPKELVKQIDGEVEYFHASPVCKNYSQAKSNHAEVELDKETAASTAEFINAIKPKVVTIENVKGYKDSDAMKTITDALDANGYTWDADVYNAADYGGYTNRERLIVRAVRDGKLPEKPKKMAHKSGWYEAVADIIPTLTEKKNGVAPWMDVRLKADGIDWRNIDKPLYVMGSAYADGKIPHAFADELLPTLRTKSGDVIVMPDGKVYRAMGRVLARVSGVSDDYKMPFSENLSHTIIGNGIPTQLTEHVIAPLLQNTLRPTTPEDGNTKFSLRYDKFEHDLNQWKKDNNLPKDAQRPTIPQRNTGESAVDFLRRVDEYRKQMALWKTAPTYEQHLLSDDTALGEFNRELQKGSVLKRIAFQDSMLAIRKAQEAIMKEVGVDRLNMAEDAYTAENRSHGKGKNEFEEYNNEFLQPLRKAYHQMKKILGDSYDNVRIYMMAKHGLERDAQMAFKKSLDADFEDVAQRSAAYRAYKGDMNRITNDSDLEFGRVDFNTWRQRDNALRTKYSPSYMDYRYDENGIAYDYSGLSALFGGSDFEEAAHKLVRDIESSHVAEVQDLWNATNAATKKILRDGYKAGMMSKDTYLYVRDMYSHYIPLRGWDGTTADQVWDYVGGGKGAFNQTLKTAHGRTSIADDTIAYIENMAESGILLNNKNWVKQHLMLLAQNHPTSLLTLSKAWYVKSVDDNGNEEWIPATPQITSQMDSNQVKAAIDAFEKKMEQMAQTGDATQKREGLNIAYPQTHSEEREHEVRVMKDGEEYVIYVNGDPQLAQAMNNTRAHRVREIQSGKLDRAAAWLGRKMAAAYTSLSPLFIPSNYFRDLTMTLASTAIREDAKYNYLLRKNLATSWNLGFMLRDYQNGKLRDKVNNENATPKEQMFYDFMMNGGETGFVSSLDVEDLKKKFKNDLKDLDRWKTNPVKVGHTIMDGIEFLNRAIEDSNRFAVYMTSIQYGRSIDEAVNDAKDVTLNFNRKGTGEYGWQMIRNLYLFINPAVQSLQTLGALVKHHPFKFTAVTASWLASGVLVPIVNAALMSLLGSDDDKDKYWQFTKWDRRNNLIMWVPFTHEYIKIPLAQEFRAFYGIGDMIASKMMGGELAEESWSQYAEDLLGQVVDMLPLDPTGYDGNIAVSLMPNAIRPVFELAFNVDFTGKPLFKETEYNKYDPNFTKAYVGTPDWLVRASKMVNSIGNDYPDVQQNSIDAFGDPRYNLNNPAVVDHVLSSYLGGAYTMVSQVLGVLTKSLNDPKEIKVADIPLFSKFVSNPDDRPVTKKQGDEFWDMKENHDRAANTLSKLKKQAKVDGDYSLLERFYGSEEYKQYKQDDVKVKKYEEDKKKERAEESGEEYRPHKLNAEDVYKAHATQKDDFEDLKLKQLYTKLNGFKTSYDLLVDTAPSQSDGYYNTNKAAIDAIDEIALDKQEISELKKGFLDDGKDAYNAEDMKQIRDLRKKILAVLEKANKVVVANQKAKAEK
nr:MAG TPA: Cytosine specific methyltransferase [Caudoviricetes sp.]